MVHKIIYIYMLRIVLSFLYGFPVIQRINDIVLNKHNIIVIFMKNRISRYRSYSLRDICILPYNCIGITWYILLLLSSSVRTGNAVDSQLILTTNGKYLTCFVLSRNNNISCSSASSAATVVGCAIQYIDEAHSQRGRYTSATTLVHNALVILFIYYDYELQTHYVENAQQNYGTQ